MTPKERHFEFMKVVMPSLMTGNAVSGATLAVLYADAALAEFDKRWPEEETCKHESTTRCIGTHGYSDRCLSCKKGVL